MLQDFSQKLKFCTLCNGLVRSPDVWLSPHAESERYKLHQNSELNAGYRRFLRVLLDAAKPFVVQIPQEPLRALDFGCGPTPLIHQDFEQARWEAYDPLFFPVSPKGTYGLIYASECLEHFRFPYQEFQYLNSLLCKGGLFAVSTEQPPTLDPELLKKWHYLSDPTHIFFYTSKTWEWIAHHWNWTLLYTDHKRIWILKKNEYV